MAVRSATSNDRRLDELSRALGARIKPELLERALTHTSYANDHDCESYERLEFLGDAVLGQVVSAHIFREYPALHEGELSRLRAALVSRNALAGVARGLGIGAYLRLGPGEEGTGGRNKSSVLADAMEAIFGAAYLDRGMTRTARLVLKHLTPLLATAMPDGQAPPSDPKTQVQEYAARHRLPAPAYVVTSTGPEHNPTFHAEIQLGEEIGRGVGQSRKAAEAAAAAALLQRLDDVSGARSTGRPGEDPGRGVGRSRDHAAAPIPADVAPEQPGVAG